MSSVDEINKEAFAFVELIAKKPIQKSGQRITSVGSFKERPTVDMSDKLDGRGVCRIVNDLDESEAIFFEPDGIGIDEEIYPRFRTLLNSVLSIDNFNSILSYEFVETHTFSWLLEIYKSKKASDSLVEHIMAKADKERMAYVFSFPVLNLNIEEPFKIGEVEFFFYTKENLDDLFLKRYQAKAKGLKKEEFDQVFRTDYQGRVLAKI